MKQLLLVSVLAGTFVFTASQLNAQEIVHALCGTVSSINPADKTITLFQDSGSRATFKMESSPKTSISLDKKVANDVTTANEFHSQGAYVILFYFGGEDNRTAVAVKSLGAGPFTSTTGEVTKWNGHDRTISVAGTDGAAHSFKIDAQTVAETYMGVENGSKFNIDKGEQVRLVSSVKNGTPTVLFIREK